MPPKPFPYPIGVGSDICSTSRVAALVADPRLFSRFGRKLFTRLEWPSLLRKILETKAKDLTENIDYRNRLKRRLPILHLPRIIDSTATLNGTEKTPEGALVRFCAGR